MRLRILAMLSALAIASATSSWAHGDKPHPQYKMRYVVNDEHKCIKKGCPEPGGLLALCHRRAWSGNGTFSPPKPTAAQPWLPTCPVATSVYLSMMYFYMQGFPRPRERLG